MKDDKPLNILNSYFGKHFTVRARVLFGRWLRAKGEIARKEELLFGLWRQSPAEVSSETHEDWNHLEKHLYTIPIRKISVPFYRQLSKYAAVAGFMLLTAAGSYYMANQHTSQKQIEMAEFFVPYGESRLVTLPDSSKVWVDAGSMLVYPKDFTDMSVRSVYLSGKASFRVSKNPEKPFIVKTTYLDVEALGTVFTLKSYPADIYTEATLEKGSVRVDVKEGSNQSSILKPNEQLVYTHKDGTVRIKTIDANLYGMERDGYLIFDNASFTQLLSALERKFNVVIQYNSQKYGNQFYNVKFAPDESLEEVLEILQQLTGLHYKIKKNVVYIH